LTSTTALSQATASLSSDAFVALSQSQDSSPGQIVMPDAQDSDAVAMEKLRVAGIEGGRIYKLGMQQEEYADRMAVFTRNALGIPDNQAFEVNDTAGAMLTAMAEKAGIYPPPGMNIKPDPNEPGAVVTTMTPGGQPIESMTWNVNHAATMSDIESWLAQRPGKSLQSDMTTTFFGAQKPSAAVD
jgi:hypothetical protein